MVNNRKRKLRNTAKTDKVVKKAAVAKVNKETGRTAIFEQENVTQNLIVTSDTRTLGTKTNAKQRKSRKDLHLENLEKQNSVKGQMQLRSPIRSRSISSDGEIADENSEITMRDGQNMIQMGVRPGEDPYHTESSDEEVAQNQSPIASTSDITQQGEGQGQTSDEDSEVELVRKRRPNCRSDSPRTDARKKKIDAIDKEMASKIKELHKIMKKQKMTKSVKALTECLTTCKESNQRTMDENFQGENTNENPTKRKQLDISNSEETIYNKKVLLCERKRHTTRSVASTPYVVLSWLTPPPQWLTPPRRLDLTHPPCWLDLKPPWLDLTPPPCWLDLTPPPCWLDLIPPCWLDLTPPG